MTGNGLCLLERNELKFECSTKKAPVLMNRLWNLGFTFEIFNDRISERIANLVFLSKDDCQENYVRPRIRAYYQDNLVYNDVLWIEKKRKVKGFVVKERKKVFELMLTSTVKKFVSEKFFPKFFLDYERKALNLGLKLRITFDFDIKYYALTNNFAFFKFGKLLGKEKVVIIKVKFVDVLPKSIKNVFKGLKPARSKVARGLKFLEESK